MSDREITFKIVEHLGVISTKDTGWNRELNLVSWNDQKPKFDIRDWDKDHERMSRGITLFEEEMEKLVECYNARSNKK